MALEENDISIIRDQMSSLLTSVESRIDAKFSQFSSILGSNNSSISNLREDIRRFEQSSSQITGGGSGGRRRDSGLPIPVHHSGSGGAGGGGGAPNAINLAVRQASLLENGARDVAKYAQDLLTATNNIGGQLHTARALNTELRNLLQVSRSSEGAGAHTRLREYVSMQEFQDDLDTMRSQTRRFARSLSSPGNIQNGSKVLDEYMRTQGLITQREQLQLHALTGRFDETQGVADNVKELVLSMGVSSGANVAGRMTTPESVSASVDKFLQLPEEHLSFLGRSSDILEKIKNSSSVDDENFKRLNIAAQGAVKNEELAGYSASLSSVFRPDDFASQIEGMRKRITAKDVIDPRKIAALSGRISQSVDYVRQARAAGKPNEAAEDNLKSLYASFGGREGIKSFSETVGQELSEFQKKRLEGGTLTEEEEERESTLVATMQQLISALSQLGAESEASSQKQSTTIAGLISSVVGALSVQQFLMMRYVQQPYQYETLPALGAMGSTGMMGDALSGAYGAQESALQGFREFGVGGSFALGGAAGLALGALTSNPLAKVGLGIAGTVVGGGIGIANQDFIAQFLSGDMSDNAFQAELGKRVLDPQKFSNEFLLPTMQARINLGLDGREDSEGRAISSSRVLDSFSSEAARSMGYDSVIVGQLIGAGLSSMRPDLSPGNDVDAARFIDTIANLEGFGVSKESGVGLLSTISAAGSEDFRETLARLAFASSEDGEITNYTMNVLVPALAKVVESRSIQNISRNSELVERETAGLFSFFKNSDTNLGKMLGANPEMMSRVFDMLGQVQESALQDPALMLFLNRMGVSFADVIGGDPRALLEPMGLFSQYADYDVSGNINLDSMASISSLVGFLQATGVGVTSGTLNIASEMFSAMEQSRMTGSEFSGEGFMERLRMESPEHQLSEAFRQFADRMTAITGSEGAEVTRNIVDETSKFFDLMSQNANSMLALQDGVRSVLGDSRAIGRSVAEAGIKILEQLSKVTNVDMSERITDLKRDILSSEVGSNLEKRQIIEDLPPEAVNSLFTNSSKSLGGGLLVNPESYREGGGYQVGYSRFFALAGVEDDPRDLQRNRRLQQALREGGDFNEALTFSSQRGARDLFTDEFYTNIDTLISNLGNESHAFRVNAGGNVLSFFSREQISNIDANQLSNYQAYVINQSVLEGNKLTGTDAIKFNDDLRPVKEHWGFATGGYTGTGTRLEPVGVVHGGEYVISDNNVSGNLQTLQRMQAGEKMDEFSPFDTTVNSGGDTIRVTLEFSNTNPEEIINAARMSARAMLRDERLL